MLASNVPGLRRDANKPSKYENPHPDNQDAHSAQQPFGSPPGDDFGGVAVVTVLFGCSDAGDDSLAAALDTLGVALTLFG